MVRPKLAYAEARATAKNPRNRISDFRGVMDKAHSAVYDNMDQSTSEDRLKLVLEARFQRFVDFFEAILAYHKAYGGRD